MLIPNGEGSSPQMDRRSALAIVAGGVVTLLGGCFGLIGGFISNVFRRSPPRPWLRIGPAEDLDAQTFQKYVLRVDYEHAWIMESKALLVYIKDLYPKDPVALLSTCSHLGCSVRWDSESKKFRCPCHGGVYDEEGDVTEGPPPQPLTRLEVKIEQETCYVRAPGGEAF